MPKMKRNYNRHEDLQRAIYGAMGLLGTTYEDLTGPMQVKSRQTVAARIKDPDKMTLGDLRRLCAALGIPAEEARTYIKF